MKNTILFSALALSVSTSANSYRDAISFLENAPTEIKSVMDNAPVVYKFKSQFGPESSVAYTGQVFRQHLINDIKTTMSSTPTGAYPGTVSEAKNMLLSYYQYSENSTLTGVGVIDGFTDFKASPKSVSGQSMSIAEGFVYADIQSPGKNLYSKIAGIDNPLRRKRLYGTKMGSTPDQYLNSLFDLFADNAVNGKSFTVPNGNRPSQTISTASVTANGLDLAELTQKFIHGAVAYSQAARDYLATDLGPTKGLNADNENSSGGATYTAMEHHFDEAFGYFGAARDYGLYTDAQLRSKVSIDTDGDGFISALTELNTGMATNFARMDITAADQNLDLSKTAMDAFLKGRHLITEKPNDYKDYVIAQAQVALGAWERTFAAITIHYINRTLVQYDVYGSDQYLFKSFAKFWGEMKGFAFAFQFNPNATMSDETFDKIHELMGDVPVLPHADEITVDSYVLDLLNVRKLIQETYEFSDNNVQNW